MIGDLERSILNTLLPQTGTMVEISSQRLATTQAISGLRPRLMMHAVTPDSSLDIFCAAAGIQRIHLLNISGENEGVLAALRRATDLLGKKQIDIIRFNYGQSFRVAGESLFELAAFLLPWGYSLIKFTPGGATRVQKVQPAQDDYQPAVYLAIAARFDAMFLQDPKPDSIIDVRGMFERYQLTARGVIHLGAHDGEELALYKQMGFKKILFVEANPELAQRIRRVTVNEPAVTVAHCAVTDADGTIALRVTSSDQGSSILDLKVVKDYYPTITETCQVTVPGRKLDTLLRELGLSPQDFNYLHMDIQGAEFMALKGANGLLGHIQALTTEVNFEELYEGCALFDTLDDFLTASGLRCKEIACAYHASWGDAFYVRASTATAPAESTAAAPGRTLTMSSLGRNGRFGNQLFQYFFLRLLARQHQMSVQTPPWIGRHLFGHNDPPVAMEFPPLVEGLHFAEAAFPAQLMEGPTGNRDLWGYFQFDTVHLAPYKSFFRSLFRPTPAIEHSLHAAMERAGMSDGRTIVALHIRRSDYTQEGVFFAAPTAWYRDLLTQLWPTLKNPILYIATDDPAKVLPDFRHYQPLSAADLDASVPEAPFYADFHVLSQADVLAISNSSFSFVPAMLNERCKVFYRPHQHFHKLMPFDPWNSPPLLHRELGKPLAEILQPSAPAPLSQPATESTVQVHGQTASGGMIVSFQRPG